MFFKIGILFELIFLVFVDGLLRNYVNFYFWLKVMVNIKNFINICKLLVFIVYIVKCFIFYLFNILYRLKL